MAPWDRIKPDRARELERLRAVQSPEARRHEQEVGGDRESWLDSIVQILREGHWAPLAEADEFERNWYAQQLSNILALGTDADVADYLRVMEADPPERPARPLDAYQPLVARLRMINVPEDAE